MPAPINAHMAGGAEPGRAGVVECAARYTARYTLHVWAWKENPTGISVVWRLGITSQRSFTELLEK